MICSLPIFIARTYAIDAQFSIPSLALVAENDSTLTICSSVAIFPPNASLAYDVTLSLSTIDGTGNSNVHTQMWLQN